MCTSRHGYNNGTNMGLHRNRTPVSREWRKLVEKQLHLLGLYVAYAFRVAYRSVYPGADKHTERSLKRRMCKIENARNGVWVAMEGWVREMSTNRKGRIGVVGRDHSLTMLSVTYIVCKISWGTFSAQCLRLRLCFLVFSSLNYYISAIIYWIFTMCVPKW